MKKCVWVLELGMLDALGKRIERYIIWEAFNTRAEAVDARNEHGKPRTDTKRRPFGVPKKYWRIVKYVPAAQGEKQP